MTRKEFAKPWAKLCAAYPRFEASEVTIAVYYERLSRFPIEKINAAITNVIDHREFFPSVAELISAIRSLPAPHLKLLDEPKPTPEQVARNLEILREIRETIGRPMTQQPKITEEERIAILKAQAAKILSEESMPAVEASRV